MEDVIETPKKLSASSWIIVVLIILNIFDFGTTYHAVEYMGIEEANPVLAYFMELFQTTWAILWFKTLIFSIFLLLYNYSSEFYNKFQRPILTTALLIITGMYVIVVTSNFSIVFTGDTFLSF